MESGEGGVVGGRGKDIVMVEVMAVAVGSDGGFSGEGGTSECSYVDAGAGAIIRAPLCSRSVRGPVSCIRSLVVPPCLLSACGAPYCHVVSHLYGRLCSFVLKIE